ncbi:MAG: AAA family ATPase [Polyangiales bacterium]
MPVAPLEPAALHRRCDPATLAFETTRELEPLVGRLGQDRALEALEFGVGVRREGYNLVAMGAPGSGRYFALRGVLARHAASEPVPQDVCYVHDFAQPSTPKLLLLPAGTGRKLKRDLADLVDDLRAAIPGALENEEFVARRHAIEADFKEHAEKDLQSLRERAEKRDVAIVGTPMGFALAPIKDGAILKPAGFADLPDTERERLQHEIEAVGAELQKLIEEGPRREQAARHAVKALVRDTLTAAVGHLLTDLRARYAERPPVVQHLEALEHDVLEHVDDFLKQEDGPAALLVELGRARGERFRRYEVNVLVDHGDSKGAPVVFEDHPTFDNLLGRIEHQPQLGALVTDFSLMRAGALHRANGGYLVLELRGLLQQPYAYEGLKRALRTGQVRTEPLGQALGLVSTVSLEPEPLPLAVKVVLYGERRLSYLLEEADPDFRALFKVVVDFDDEVDRTAASEGLLARSVAGVVSDEKLLAFDRGAVARVIEHAARLADDAEKLSAHRGELADLLRESDHFAAKAGRALVSAAEVEAAIDARERRVGRIRERVLDDTRRGTMLVATDGERVGQINGLSVVSLGRFAFGRPARITANVRLGAGEVVDVEREVELGGPIHSKGVLILSSYLGARYAHDHPMSLKASLVFEQSYGMVDGDSASSAELYALVSALSGVAIKQSIAVTGSVNQHGEVQAIGGVNEKIEGFFDLCRSRGLTGAQGVMIPRSNVKHLALRRDVVEAAAAGTFRVWAVEHVDEGIEVLTGLAAGQRDEAGAFPEGSVNARVEARLIALARRRLELAAEAKKEERS